VCKECLSITVPSNIVGGVGITEKSDDIQVGVFPNPNTGIFHVSLSDGIREQTKMMIRTLVGTIIFNQSLISGETKVDISDYLDGIYFLEIYRAPGQIKRVKLIVR